MPTIPPPSNTFEDEAAYRGFRRVGSVRFVAPGYAIHATTLAELEEARAAHYAARAAA